MECYDDMPEGTILTSSEKRENTRYFYDGEGCKAIQTENEKTSNLFSSLVVCEALCVDRCNQKHKNGKFITEDCKMAQEQTRWFWDGEDCQQFR